MKEHVITEVQRRVLFRLSKYGWYLFDDPDGTRARTVYLHNPDEKTRHTVRKATLASFIKKGFVVKAKAKDADFPKAVAYDITDAGRSAILGEPLVPELTARPEGYFSLKEALSMMERKGVPIKIITLRHAASEHRLHCVSVAESHGTAYYTNKEAVNAFIKLYEKKKAED